MEGTAGLWNDAQRLGLRVSRVSRLLWFYLFLCLLSTGPSLPPTLRREVAERICRRAATLEPPLFVLVNVTDCSLETSIELARHARSCGAAAVAAAAPFYYFPLVDDGENNDDAHQSGLIDWFRRLADASDLPVLLYNIPSCVRHNLNRETVRRLSRHQNIVGIKDSSGDLDYFRGLCADHGDDEGFSILQGTEELIPQGVDAGADGAISGGANLFPRLYAQLFESCRQKSHQQPARTSSLAQIVRDIVQHIYHDENGRMNLVPAIKYAMQSRQLCTGILAPPLQGPAPAHRDAIDARLPVIAARVSAAVDEDGNDKAV